MAGQAWLGLIQVTPRYFLNGGCFFQDTNKQGFENQPVCSQYCVDRKIPVAIPGEAGASSTQPRLLSHF